MKGKVLKSRLFAFTIAMLAFVLAFAFCGGMISAFAATDRTNIFRETLEDDEIDGFKWEMSKEGASAISVQNVGRNGLSISPVNNSVKLQYEPKIVLSEGQYFEFEGTFSNLVQGVFTSFKFSPTKAETDEDIVMDTPEMVSFKAGDGMYAIYSDVATKYTNAWSGLIDIPEGWSFMNFVNGNSTMGLTGSYASVSWKVRIHADGSANYMIADGGVGNYFEFMTMGGAENTYFQAIGEGYFQIILQGNAQPVFFNELKMGIYESDGTAVSGSEYEEDFDSLENSSFATVNGEASVAAASKAIVIDNAADDDYLVKKSALSVPANNYAETLYDLDLTLSLPELSGAAKAVIYAGAASSDDLSSAARIEFSCGAGGGIEVSLAGATAVPVQPALDTAFVLKIACGSDGVNKVSVDGTEVGTFEKEMAGKFIAFGTTGCSGEAKAKFAIHGAEFYRYNYQQGNGGDFTETFDDNKYNGIDLSITSQTEDRTNEITISGGALVTQNAAYTTIISSNQSYGDFEFVFEISAFTDEMCNFNISWGRPNGVTGYDNQGVGVWTKEGSDLNIMKSEAMSDVDYADGYSRWISADVALPTDKLTDEGEPMETTNCIWDYNFSEGNLVVKTVKQGTQVSIYIYTAESAEDDWGRLNPVCVLVNDYTYGTVGLCSLPTGINMNMKIDSFSVKNIDKHKADELIIGDSAVRNELSFEEEEGPIDDPLDDSDKEPGDDNPSGGDKQEETGTGGCSGVVFGSAGLIGLALSVTGAGLLRKKKN